MSAHEYHYMYKKHQHLPSQENKNSSAQVFPLDLLFFPSGLLLSGKTSLTTLPLCSGYWDKYQNSLNQWIVGESSTCFTRSNFLRQIWPQWKYENHGVPHHSTWQNQHHLIHGFSSTRTGPVLLKETVLQFPEQNVFSFISWDYLGRWDVFFFITWEYLRRQKYFISSEYFGGLDCFSFI